MRQDTLFIGEGALVGKMRGERKREERGVA